jgi:hypothetical protein
MKRTDYPEIRHAKTLCLFALIVSGGLIILSFKYRWLWDFGNSLAGWITCGIAAAAIAIVALRAIIRSR